MEIPESTPEKSSSSETDSGSCVAILQERLSMYNEAIQAAKVAGDASKVRRYQRALKVSF